MSSGVYGVLNDIEEQLENGVMLFGFVFVNKNLIQKNIKNIYINFPAELGRRGKSYAAAKRLENIVHQAFSIAGNVIVFKPQIMSFIDEIYASLPQDIKDFC